MVVHAPTLIGLAELQATSAAAMLTCLGLGSCVSVCALDPEANVSGMAHIMLPKSAETQVDKPAKFADTGVTELVQSMEKLGASRERLVVAVAGGASVGNPDQNWDLGKRNSEAVIEQINRLGIKCVAHDLGGSQGRTVTMSSDTGSVVVRTISKGEDVLCSLRG